MIYETKTLTRLKSAFIYYLLVICCFPFLVFCDKTDSGIAGGLSTGDLSDPTSFVVSSASTTALTLTWISAAGLEAPVQISFLSGATPPDTCLMGSIINSAIIVDSEYVVSGLLVGTQYSFRICSVSSSNSDLISGGVTVSGQTVTQNDISISDLVISNIQTDGFSLALTYAGDTNTDASVVYYICNETDSPSCDPSLTTPVAMLRSGTQFTASVNGLTDPNDAGDSFNIQVTAVDADNSTNPSLSGTATSLLALFDTGLVARYYLEEATTGQSPATVLDAVSVSAVNLNLTYLVGGILNYINLGSGLGLNWSAIGDSSRACVDVAGTKHYSNLHGSSTGTLEVVSDIIDGIGNGSRLVHFGDNSNSSFSIEYSGSALTFEVDSGILKIDSTVNLSLLGRTVITVVFDSSQAINTDRGKIYINGVLQPIDVGAIWPNQYDPIDLSDASTYFCIGNREIGSRSPNGSIFYSSVYSSALPADKILRNANILLVNDDAP